jgi:hypothetical protein
MRLLALMLVVGLLTWMPALGQSRVLNEQTLAHLEGVGVVVEDLDEDTERHGLTKNAIETDVELALRRSGIKVYSLEERLDTPSMAYLYVQVNTLKSSNGLYALNVHMSVNQMVYLTTGDYTFTETYSPPDRVGTTGAASLRDVRGLVKDLVNEFINDWLKVHQE